MNRTIQHASVIICAYNEEKTIDAIIRQILECPEADEVIIINDGSTDSTGLILRSFEFCDRIQVISYPINQGKGHAMAAGVLQAHNEYLVFIDADLSGFQEKYIRQLLQPLKEGRTRMVIGQPVKARIDFRLNPFTPISGQRAVFRRDLLPLIPRMYESRFGVETLVNMYYKANRLKIRFIGLKGLSHPMKAQKYSFRKSVREYSHAGMQIFRTVLLNSSLIGIILRNTFIRFFQ